MTDQKRTTNTPTQKPNEKQETKPQNGDQRSAPSRNNAEDRDTNRR